MIHRLGPLHRVARLRTSILLCFLARLSHRSTDNPRNCSYFRRRHNLKLRALSDQSIRNSTGHQLFHPFSCYRFCGIFVDFCLYSLTRLCYTGVDRCNLYSGKSRPWTSCRDIWAKRNRLRHHLRLLQNHDWNFVWAMTVLCDSNSHRLHSRSHSLTLWYFRARYACQGMRGASDFHWAFTHKAFTFHLPRMHLGLARQFLHLEAGQSLMDQDYNSWGPSVLFT